jgi:hypothetical protein
VYNTSFSRSHLQVEKWKVGTRLIRDSAKATLASLCPSSRKLLEAQSSINNLTCTPRRHCEALQNLSLSTSPAEDPSLAVKVHACTVTLDSALLTHAASQAFLLSAITTALHSPYPARALQPCTRKLRLLDKPTPRIAQHLPSIYSTTTTGICSSRIEEASIAARILT